MNMFTPQLHCHGLFLCIIFLSSFERCSVPIVILDSVDLWSGDLRHRSLCCCIGKDTGPASHAQDNRYTPQSLHCYLETKDNFKAQ